MANITNLHENELEIFEPPPLSEDHILRIATIASIAVIIVVGVAGNLASCIVILQNRSMRTVTNLYLLNLAASDLIMLIILIPNSLFLWKTFDYPLGKIGCKLHFFVTFFLFNNGIMTILALTIERYFAVCHPLFSKARPKSRVIKIVFAVWVFSAVLSLYSSFEVGIASIRNVVFCTFIPSSRMRVINFITDILTLLIPMIIIAFVFVMIVLKLNQNDKCKNRSFNKTSSRRKATRMLAVMMLAFFVCWTPHIVLRTLLFMANNSNFKAIFKKIGNGLYYVWLISTWLGTAINPIIFSLMSDQFKTAFKALLKRNGNKEKLKSRQVIKTIQSLEILKGLNNGQVSTDPGNLINERDQSICDTSIMPTNVC